MPGAPRDPSELGAPAEAAPVAVARDAATIMLVRDSRTEEAGSLEVCMLRRHLDSDFLGGAYVFPGGKLDDCDREPRAVRLCQGRSDAQASEMLGVLEGGLAFWVAALRECFEEAGVLLAYRGGSGAGTVVDASDEATREQLKSLRHRLNAGEIEFSEVLESANVSLAVDRVHYFSHWITPELAPKRYDTRFFVAALPAGQVPVHDDHETVETVWVRPLEALERGREGALDLIFPTMKNLQAIGRFATSAELLHAAATAEQVPAILPRVVSDGRGVRIVLPGDPGYDDAMAALDVRRGESAGPGQPGREEIDALVRSIDVEGRIRRNR